MTFYLFCRGCFVFLLFIGIYFVIYICDYIKMIIKNCINFFKKNCYRLRLYCSFRGIIVSFFWVVGLLNGFCPLVGVFRSFHCLSVWRWKTSICTVPWSQQRLFIYLFLLISPLFSAISVFFLSFRVCVWCSTLVSVFRYCICDLSNHCCYCYYSKMKPSTRRSPRSSAPSGEAASSPTAKAKVSFVYACFDLWCVWTVFVYFYALCFLHFYFCICDLCFCCLLGNRWV